MRNKRIRLGVVVAAAVAVGGAAVALAATGVGSTDYAHMYRMMGRGYVYQPSKAEPVRTLAGARADAQKFADRLGLNVDEVLQFKQNFYAKLVDGHGTGATEVLVDPQTGLVSIEYGPAMMWNARYGMGRGGAWMMGSYGYSMMRGYGGAMMGSSGYSSGYSSGMMGSSGYSSGMMGGNGSGSGSIGSSPTSTGTTVTIAAAHTLAQRWLDAHEPSMRVETGGDAFPGYYTLETLRNGKITGMISVNRTTGAVWPHWWHGAFVAKLEA
jgi:hypothetical protein